MGLLDDALGSALPGGNVSKPLMIALTAISQLTVTPKMAALRTQMGSIQATAVDSPLLVEFAKLHQVSVTLESGVLLAGIACMFLMVRELASK